MKTDRTTINKTVLGVQAAICMKIRQSRRDLPNGHETVHQSLRAQTEPTQPELTTHSVPRKHFTVASVTVTKEKKYKLNCDCKNATIIQYSVSNSSFINVACYPIKDKLFVFYNSCDASLHYR